MKTLNKDLIMEKYKGIRPPGYPACPDHTETLLNCLI